MAQHIIQQVQSGIEGRNEAIQSIYTDTSIRNAVIGTLVKLGCQEIDAKDHFTDAIVSFVKACYRPGFSISSSLTNYLIGTAKNIWLKAVTKSNRQRTTIEYQPVTSEPPIEDHLISNERKLLLRKLIDHLDDACKKVLLLWAQNNKMKEIATQLRYKSEGMARKKKHNCMKKLYSIVENNTQIKKDLSTL